jgi:hypothetical protein
MSSGFEAESALADEIGQFIGDPDKGDFNDLFLRLFARQYRRNEAYRMYCESLDATPGSVREWFEVPAVPAVAFKTITLSCVPVEEASVVFHSSGTSDGRPGKHYLDRTAAGLYRASLRAGYCRRLPSNLPIIALMPSPYESPNSSLSYMLAALGAGAFYSDDAFKLGAALDRAADIGEPVCVFGTAFAFVELSDTQVRSWTLPGGSYAIETGGLKGRTRNVSRDELHDMIARRLGIHSANVVSEYGMSEMASQYYSAGAGFAGGHWVRARIVDPITQRDAAEALLRHYDLANWNSVAAIQTQDVGRLIAGSDSFELLGRAPQSEARGCSLAVEERWPRPAAS